MPTQPTAPDPTPARPPVRSTAWWKRHGPLRRRPRVDVTGINGRYITRHLNALTGSPRWASSGVWEARGTVDGFQVIWTRDPSGRLCAGDLDGGCRCPELLMRAARQLVATTISRALAPPSPPVHVRRGRVVGRQPWLDSSPWAPAAIVTVTVVLVVLMHLASH
jgi:hypothetical protein